MNETERNLYFREKLLSIEFGLISFLGEEFDLTSSYENNLIEVIVTKDSQSYSAGMTILSEIAEITLYDAVINGLGQEIRNQNGILL